MLPAERRVASLELAKRRFHPFLPYQRTLQLQTRQTHRAGHIATMPASTFLLRTTSGIRISLIISLEHCRTSLFASKKLRPGHRHKLFRKLRSFLRRSLLPFLDWTTHSSLRLRRVRINSRLNPLLSILFRSTVLRKRRKTLRQQQGYLPSLYRSPKP